MIVDIPTARSGLNLKDRLDQMPISYSIQMDNIIPEETADRVRKGHVEISTSPIDTLIGFNVDPNEAVIGATTNTISEINLSTGVLTQLATGFTSSDWVQTFFTDGAGGGSVFICNGEDTPQRIYDDGTLQCGDFGFTAPSGPGSGLDLTDLSYPLGFKNRMYFVEKGTFSLYYGDLQAIAGELTQFNVSGFVRDGGSILGIANWTQDAGQGFDNLLAIFTTEGEVLIYQGTSPEASDWQLRGNYRISRPIGRRFFTNLGGDLIVITEQGYLPLSAVLSQDRANRVQVSDKINPIVKGKDFTEKWGIHWYSKEGWVLVNAPFGNNTGKYEQHVYNIQTGGWCRFVGMDAFSWLVQKDRIFFCNSKGVFEANVGFTDNNKAITYVNQRAYSKLDVDNNKQPIRIRPRYNSEGGFLNSNVKYGIDFSLGEKQRISSAGIGVSAFWDEAIWDESFWSDENKVENFKASMFSNIGKYISVGFFGETDINLEFYSTELLYRRGNDYI
jgi:hypothetical protein